jgi:hypothetical protein
MHSRHFNVYSLDWTYWEGKAMDRANIAEWLLRQVVDPVRASEIVGDQLEARPTVGNLRFWISISLLLLRFSWRTLVGVAASPVMGVFLASAFLVFVNPRLENTLGLSERTVVHLQSYLIGVSVLLWAETVFSLVRLGWRNSLTCVGLIASALWSCSFAFFWQPAYAVVLTILWAGFFVFCLSSSKRRRTLAILCCSVLAAWLTAFALYAVFGDPYSVFGKWQAIAALFLVPIVESSTTMFLRRKLIAR